MLVPGWLGFKSTLAQEWSTPSTWPIYPRLAGPGGSQNTQVAIPVSCHWGVPEVATARTSQVVRSFTA